MGNNLLHIYAPIGALMVHPSFVYKFNTILRVSQSARHQKNCSVFCAERSNWLADISVFS